SALSHVRLPKSLCRIRLSTFTRKGELLPAICFSLNFSLLFHPPYAKLKEAKAVCFASGYRQLISKGQKNNRRFLEKVFLWDS
ncbi:MAG: hypothetical protein NC304_00610, partial [Robinsoniella sp.]|nr:hypothetical protein [Robinsoniella sp.]